MTLCENNNLANHGRILNEFYVIDKIHLNEEGSSVLASNISSTLKYVMGIDIKRHYSPKKGNRNGHNYHGGGNRNHGGGNRNHGGGNHNHGGGNRGRGVITAIMEVVTVTVEVVTIMAIITPMVPITITNSLVITSSKLCCSLSTV